MKPNDKYIVVQDFEMIKFSSMDTTTVVEGSVLVIKEVLGAALAFSIDNEDTLFFMEVENFKLYTEPYEENVDNKQFGKILSRNIPFSDAMYHLAKGKKVTRSIWGGYWKEQVIFTADGEGNMMKRKAIVAFLKDGGWAIASPYQEDMLASDWMVVE